MRLVFIDDSEQRKPARQRLGDLIAVGAVIVPDDQLAAFAGRLVEIKADLGIPDSEEIKWKPHKGSHLARAGLAPRGAVPAAQERRPSARATGGAAEADPDRPFLLDDGLSGAVRVS